MYNTNTFWTDEIVSGFATFCSYITNSHPCPSYQIIVTMEAIDMNRLKQGEVNLGVSNADDSLI